MGKITAKAQQEGYVIHASDGLIAATALQHGLHLMTRNVKDFEPTHVMLINPWIKGVII
jgi:predicted nucleic acid-binding protein